MKCLAIHNLAFRGTNEKIYEDGNGNFLGLLEMIAEFDPVMQHHFRLIQDKKIHFIFESVNGESPVKHLMVALQKLLNRLGNVKYQIETAN